MSNERLTDEELAVVNLMRTEEGRRLVISQLNYCGIFETMFDKDPIQQAFNAGMREAGFNLDRLIKRVAPDEYLKMLKESFDAQ